MRSENLAIVFIDIVGFTPRTSSQSREQNEQMLRRFAHGVRPLVRSFRGRVVKTLGDAFLLTFRSPTDALLCAMAVHDALAAHNGDLPAEERFEVRAAVNVGEVRIERGDVFGEAVNIAARIEGEAGAGDIFFSEAVYLSMTRSEVPSQEIGPRQLKGIAQPVRLYRVPPIAEVGEYAMAGSGPVAGVDHRLVPAPLPYGGYAAAQLAGSDVAGAERLGRAALAAGLGSGARLIARLSGWVRAFGRSWRRSGRFRYGVIAAALVVVVALLFVAWPDDSSRQAQHKPRKVTPVERIKRTFGF